ncbi:MAG TPA: ATP-binding cassette domain-containing protein [Gemmatimonadaceae bacterium]|nr:ATP-binding cassette domain-containing protein [Gemmatimonadaceae bacterium]
MSHALEVIDLWKSYVIGVRGCSVRVSVLRGVSFHVGQGERLGIVGAPGAGKTTLLHCIQGMRRPDAGVVLREGASTPLAVLDETTLARAIDPVACEGGALIVVREPALLAGRVDRLLVLQDGRIAPLDTPQAARHGAQRVAEHRG